MSLIQIDEMARDLEEHTCMSQFQAEIASRMLYQLGYRKAADVAEEIFADLEKKIADMEYVVRTSRKTVTVEELINQMNWLLHEVVPETIAELKKKYTEEEK